MESTRLWGHAPGAFTSLFAMVEEAVAMAGISYRQRALLVTACASARQDSYCALAWGTRLAGEVGDRVAAGVVQRSDDPLDDTDQALAAWARLVATEPNTVTPADLDGLRAAGFDDGAIFGITLLIALRMAFSTVNGALGARPDPELVAKAPEALRAAVDFGRPPRGSADQELGAG